MEHGFWSQEDPSPNAVFTAGSSMQHTSWDHGNASVPQLPSLLNGVLTPSQGCRREEDNASTQAAESG